MRKKTCGHPSHAVVIIRCRVTCTFYRFAGPSIMNSNIRQRAVPSVHERPVRRVGRNASHGLQAQRRSKLLKPVLHVLNVHDLRVRVQRFDARLHVAALVVTSPRKLANARCLNGRERRGQAQETQMAQWNRGSLQVQPADAMPLVIERRPATKGPRGVQLAYKEEDLVLLELQLRPKLVVRRRRVHVDSQTSGEGLLRKARTDGVAATAQDCAPRHRHTACCRHASGQHAEAATLRQRTDEFVFNFFF